MMTATLAPNQNIGKGRIAEPICSTITARANNILNPPITFSKNYYEIHIKYRNFDARLAWQHAGRQNNLDQSWFYPRNICSNGETKVCAV
jgi:hypothetical protein